MVFRKSAALLCALLILFSFSFSAFAAAPDFAKWNESRLFSVLEDGTDSNSDFEIIILRLMQDDEAHQLHFLVMAELSELNDINNAGIRMKFNGIGTVELFCDGSADYDSGKFFAQTDNILSDTGSNDIWIEFTVGIKAGIPENLAVELSLYDTDGVISNTYTVDISEDSLEEITDSEAEDGFAGDTGKTVKAEKVKTTKVKTTKVKTTKTKTTKVKTTKTTKSKSEKDEDDTDLKEVKAGAETFDSVRVEDEKNKLIIICAAAIIACFAGGCAAGIINGRKKNSKGDE